MNPQRRREQIRLQVEVIGPLLHVKGYAAPETKAATERARSLIEQAEQLGERLEDPLLLFSVLYSFWIANLVAFNGDAMLDLASQFLTLAERNGTSGPMMIGHRLLGLSLVHAGEIAKGRAHLDRALAFYNPDEHRVLATRFGQDLRVAILSFRSITLWLLGYTDAAFRDADAAVEFARESGQAAALMYALLFSSFTHWHQGGYTVANTQLNELIELADEKGALFWKAWATMQLGGVLTASGKSSDAIHTINSGVALWRSTGSTFWLPLYLSYLAIAYADAGYRDEAWHCVADAKSLLDTSKEALFDAEVARVAGEIALQSSNPEIAKAEMFFGHALKIARAQHAKSWELRAAMSLARLWCDQGKVQQARELLSPVYGWFTEGFDTRDLKEAKVLLDELAAQTG
jgi:predicted ATPase